MPESRLILGLDEAGRGPVLGPLVVAAVLWREEKLPQLLTLGVKDSKQLSAKKRAALAQRISALAERVEWRAIEPARLDKRNLNELTFKTTVELIKRLAPAAVLLDAPVSGRGVIRYGERLKKALAPLSPEITAKNKADVTEPIVSAASIVAKVERDRLVAALNQKYNALGALGSGYPADPETRFFLVRYLARFGDWPPEARRKWQTLAELETDFGALLKPRPPRWPFNFKKSWLALAGVALVLLALAGVLTQPVSNSLPLSATAGTVLPLPKEEMALVTKIIDGDTVTIAGGERVRLLGIDTPEVDEACYTEAKNLLGKLVLSQKVKLVSDVRDKDQYGRQLRFIFLNDKNVNLELVKAGLAVAYFFEDQLYKKEIQVAEKAAIDNKASCLWRNLP